MIRIALADPHELMREGLKVLFQKATGMCVVDESSTAYGTVAHVKANSNGCDVLLLETNMPGQTGVELIRQIKNIAPCLPVLVLTGREESGYACRAIKAGASGYVTKAGPLTELLGALERVASGRRYISIDVAEQLAVDLCCPTGLNGHENLTQREKQVFDMLLSGNSVTQIAHKLNLSVKTISSHKARAMGRMKVSSISEMVQYAVTHKLIPDFNLF